MAPEPSPARGTAHTLPGAAAPLPPAVRARLPTGQLFLDLGAPASPQEADSLTDPTLPPGLQLVGAAPEDQVPQGPCCGLLHVLVGAPQEVHQLADAPQMVNLWTQSGR